VVWAATLPNGGPTGTFTRDGRPLPWLSGPPCSASRRVRAWRAASRPPPAASGPC
jgi:hypothetical protein